MEIDEIKFNILSAYRTSDNLMRDLIELYDAVATQKSLQKYSNSELIEDISLRINSDNFSDAEYRSLMMDMDDDFLMEELIRSTASQLAEGFTASEEEKHKIISLVNILNIYLGKTSCIPD